VSTGSKTTGQEYIDEALTLLVKACQVRIGEKWQVRDETEPPRYLINTSVEDVLAFLEEKKKSGEIHIDDIPLFMSTYLVGKKGGLVSDSLKIAKKKRRR
jgi:hypothetical protein